MSTGDSPNGNMKVIALKIYLKQTKALTDLIAAGLYPSKSEVVREAGWYLLDKILYPQQQGLPLKGVTLRPEVTQIFLGPTKSISAKFPLKMLTMIDWIIAKNIGVKNRSEFFRIALCGFLASDSEIFSQFLAGNRGQMEQISALEYEG
ncbi:MAG TPA: hypothetical protein VJ044_10975 [Candidatus Hodarchaeales archaeon]|nr:hypothetical protein [Candidatus Hodarchaeales archaeon]